MIFRVILALLSILVLAGQPLWPGNLAFQKPTIQSSINGVSSSTRAVDGNVDGRSWKASVARTNSELEPWWQVDLQSVQPIDVVRLWFRTDGVAMSNFVLLLSDLPFTSTDLATSVADPNVVAIVVSTISDPYAVGQQVAVDASARYLRIQREGSGAIELAEVEVRAAGSSPGGPFAYTVDATSDDADAALGDGVCATTAGTCSLRAAIEESNVDGGPSLVAFDIPGAGVQTIGLGRELPPLNDLMGGTTIDGFTQPGASPNGQAFGSDAVVLVVVDGQGVHPLVRIKGSDNTIRGLSLYRITSPGLFFMGPFSRNNRLLGNHIGVNAAGVVSQGGSDTAIQVRDGGAAVQVGGPSVADRNIIGGWGRAVDLRDAGANDVLIENNYIGIGADEVSVLPNTIHCIDVNLNAARATIRGNVIAACSLSAIEISHGALSQGHRVEGNIIGTTPRQDSTDSIYGNGQHGIHIEDSISNVVVRDNTVVSSAQYGIRLHKKVSSVVVEDNRIGILPDGTAAPNGFGGILINQGSFLNSIGPGNVIAFNHGNAIKIAESAIAGFPTEPITVTQNSIFDNDAAGISVWGTFPVPSLERASPFSVDGTVGCAGCTVELFLSDSASSTTEGKLYLGDVVSEADGRFHMPVSPEVLSIGDQVTATATTPAGSTSRFAPSLRVAGLPQADFVVVCSGAQCTFDGSASSDTNGTIQAYLWDFDGDQIVDATGAVVSHLFPGTGNFDVTLEVVDNDNLNDVAASTITIVNTNAPPTAAFSVSCQGLDCSFDASASTDDGLITAYKWDFTDDGLVDATGLTASYTFPTAGTFDVELTVTDDESVSDATIVAVTVNNSIELGEIGTTSGTQQNSGHWNSLLFNRQYQSPIVVGGPPSINGGQQLTLRMRNVQGSGAEFQFDEYDYLDGGHVPETISYLVIEGGSHVLDNGQRLDAGAVGTSSAATTVTFSSPFASPPIVFGQIVTTNDSRAAVLRIFNVSATGFSVQIHGEEANKTYGIEAVHWVAMDPGQGQLSGRPYQVGAAGGMNGVFGNVAFSASFSGTPAIVASMQTKAGTDPCALRMKNASATGFDLKVEEEQSFDAELSHINETVGFIAMPPGSILGQSIP